MRIEQLDIFIKDFYKDLSKVRLHKWNYEDGCILIAAIALYKATNQDRYKDFVIEYVDSYVKEDGTISDYKKEDYNLDNIAPGRALIFAYDHTGNEKYKLAILKLQEQIKEQPRTESGNFWHKKIYPNQVWLDGLFMAQPFYMAVETKYGKKDGYNDINKQFKVVRNKMYSEEKGLYYHGFDESRSIFWADKETGCSKNFWLRSIGWFQMGIIDTLEAMSKEIFEHYMDLVHIYKESLNGILAYQDKDSKLFYQVVDHSEIEGNYLETSGSAMIAATIFKASHMKVILKEKYWSVGEEILHRIVEDKLELVDGEYILKDTCLVAGLGPDENRRDGSIAYYLSEPKKDNDLKGIAALFMAYAWYIMGEN